MIKNTFELCPDHVHSAYKDNAAVMEGWAAGRFFPDPVSHEYNYHHENIDILLHSPALSIIWWEHFLNDEELLKKLSL